MGDVIWFNVIYWFFFNLLFIFVFFYGIGFLKGRFYIVLVKLGWLCWCMVWLMSLKILVC